MIPVPHSTRPSNIHIDTAPHPAWLVSLSEKPYKLYPVPKATRKRGDFRWLLGPVVLQQSHRDAHPFGRCFFHSAVHLWAQYVRGYLAGDLAPGRDKRRLVVVRQEHLLHRPGAVMDALE